MKERLDSRLRGNDKIMQRCIELARKGAGHVSPNPLVGCVIVKNDYVIAEGYHKMFGSNHAEINAINNALNKGLDLTGSTLYVNLEPCSHYGKTPPCADKIIENKIKKVVIGIKDPNPLVAGKGIRKLKQNGVEVITGIFEKECIELNKFFLKNIKTSLPYVTLKAAQTLDGKIADEHGKSKWISSKVSRKLVHKLRSEYDAILIGKNTVEIDNPELTVRMVKGRNPYRIVIDKDLKLDVKKKIFSDKYSDRTIVLTSGDALLKDSKKKRILEYNNVILIPVKKMNNKLNLRDALSKLNDIGISSILVEGGAYTFSEFINQKLVDEMLIFIAPKIFGKGLDTFATLNNPIFNDKNTLLNNSGSDILFDLRF